jgi:hypothetical protein
MPIIDPLPRWSEDLVLFDRKPRSVVVDGSDPLGAPSGFACRFHHAALVEDELRVPMNWCKEQPRHCFQRRGRLISC